MVKKTSRSDRERYKYGICLNEECPKCKEKEIQQIPMRKDFLCQNPECGKELRECPPPKKSSRKFLIGFVIVLVVMIIACLCLFIPSNSSNDNEEQKDTTSVEHENESPVMSSVKADTVVVRDTIVQNNTTTIKEKTTTKTVVNTSRPSSGTSGTKDFGYAVFKGTLKGGKPDDVNGRMVYKSQHLIDSRDSQRRVAEPGDYVIGEFTEGHLVQGIWYDSSGNVKGSIIIGR